MRDENRVEKIVKSHFQGSRDLDLDMLIEIHKIHFGKEPNNIGMLWNDMSQLCDDIFDAIINDKSYDQYELLDEEDKKAWDNGALFF